MATVATGGRMLSHGRSNRSCSGEERGSVGKLVTVAAAIVGAVTTLSGCGTDPVSPIGKDEARQMQGVGTDGGDLCEQLDWYGDGQCDDFCVDPDPDCEIGCPELGCAGDCPAGTRFPVDSDGCIRSCTCEPDPGPDPDVCADVPQCDFLCPEGTENPVDADGCQHTCECVDPDPTPGPDPCAEVPQCDFLCPEGTTNPVDAQGCQHTCECVPAADPCGGCRSGQTCIYQQGGPGPSRGYLCAEENPCGSPVACACIVDQGTCMPNKSDPGVCICDNGLD
jgi:hypothetical protein